MGVISGEVLWDGKSSTDLNVVVENAPSFQIPARKMEVINVPGRNGDIIITQDAYENVPQEYDLAIICSGKELPDAVRAVMEWLMRPTGYTRLEDSFNPDVFRMAYFRQANGIENSFHRLGRAKVQFMCKPQRFLRIGEWPVLASNGMKLTNPSGYTAKPLISITGSGGATLTIGASVLTISNIDGSLVIDCESQNAYKGSVNKNSTVTLTEGPFPELKEGDTQISWTGAGVTRIDITPRWWTL